MIHGFSPPIGLEQLPTIGGMVPSDAIRVMGPMSQGSRLSRNLSVPKIGTVDEVRSGSWSCEATPPTKQPLRWADSRLNQRHADRNKILGAQGRDRTTDTVIFSHVLYQLSYLGAEPRRNGGAWVEARGL